MSRHEPRRTCVACRTTRTKHELLRFAGGSNGMAPTSTVVFDPAHQAAGRGAYTCTDLKCIELVTTRKGQPLLRTLRRRDDDVTEALDAARTHLMRLETTKEQHT